MESACVCDGKVCRRVRTESVCVCVWMEVKRVWGPGAVCVCVDRGGGCVCVRVGVVEAVQT